MNTYDVRKALWKKYSDHRQYAFAEEVGLTTGFSHRRLDMVVLDCYASNGFRIDGIEIKVSTADLRRELEDPEKHHAFFELIDYYTLAVPKGVVDPLLDVIPKTWGILIVNEDGTTRYKRKPLALQDEVKKTVPRGFLAGIVRAIQQKQPAEEEIREAYERGRKEQKEADSRHHDYMARRIEEKAADLEAYEKLNHRFSLWRGDDIDQILDEFEAFRAMRLDWTIKQIDGTIEQLTKLCEVLKLKDEEQKIEAEG